jgi:hypothetical protein
MSDGMSRTTTHAGAGLAGFAPPAIAVAHFAFSYIFAALACARRWADAQVLGFDIVPAAIVVAAVLSLATIAAIAFGRWRRRPAAAGAAATSGNHFLADASRALAVLAAAAVLLTAAPALYVPACR